jgi:hypothetical protein
LELIKDYDLEVHYHPGKTNVVADALSRKSHANEVQVMPMSSELCAEFAKLNLGFVTNTMELVIEPTLEQEIRKSQMQDAKLKEIAENIVKANRQDSVWMIMVLCGLEKGCVCMRIRL